MAELPVCRLCKTLPSTGLGYAGCANFRCSLHNAEMTVDEWNKLMGQGDPVAWLVDEQTMTGDLAGRLCWALNGSTPPKYGNNHRPLYLHPAPAVDDAVVRDAARYLWLRDKIQDGLFVIAYEGAWGLRSWSGDDPDRAIDNAIAKEKTNENAG